MVQTRAFFFSHTPPPHAYTTKHNRRGYQKLDYKAMVAAQRGPQRQAGRVLSVLLLASVLLGTASAAGGFLFKGKDNTHIKKSCDEKETGVCDASSVPSFVRLALRYRGGESKSGGAWRQGKGMMIGWMGHVYG